MLARSVASPTTTPLSTLALTGVWAQAPPDTASQAASATANRIFASQNRASGLAVVFAGSATGWLPRRNPLVTKLPLDEPHTSACGTVAGAACRGTVFASAYVLARDRGPRDHGPRF